MNDSSTTIIRTTCAGCAVGCGIVARRGPGPALSVEGDSRHPANRGRLCTTGYDLSQAVPQAGRLLYPEIAGRRAGWDKAISHVARRLSDTIARHGPESVAILMSGELPTEDHYVANKLMKGFVGSANIDCLDLSDAGNVAAAQFRALGEDVAPGTQDDIDAADLFIVLDVDLTTERPVIAERITAARIDRGARLAVVGGGTGMVADMRLPVRQGSHRMLLTGLLAHCKRAGLLDERCLADTAEVPAGFWDRLVHDYDLWSVARACAVTPADLQRFFDLFSASSRTVTLFGEAVSASRDALSAIYNLHIATGRIGRPGAAPFPLKGRTNSMGAREVGALPVTLAGHRGFEEDAIADVQRLWGAPRMARWPGLDADAMRGAVADGRIKAVWVMAGDPALYPATGSDLGDILRDCRFVVVSESFAEIGRGRSGDVRLPAAAWAERDGTLTSGDRVISRQRPLFPLPGEVRSNWWALTQTARAMGWSDAFYFERPADIYREHARLSAYRNNGARLFDLGRHAAISNPAYDELTPWRWGGAPFADGHFQTADGRARLIATARPSLAEVGADAAGGIQERARL